MRDAWGLFRSSDIAEETDTVISEEFTNHSQYSLQLMGGNESIDVSKWREWVTTVKQHPIPISYNLTPIYKLLPLNSEQRKSLAKATLHFLRQAELSQHTYISQLEALPRTPESQCQETLVKGSSSSYTSGSRRSARAATAPGQFVADNSSHGQFVA